MKTLLIFVAGLIAAPLLFALAGILGWLPSTATADPPKWEVELGERALDASLERRSASVKNPIAARDSAALAAGQELYSDNCAGCHGDAKAPSAWGSKNFYPRVPQFWQDQEAAPSPEEAYAAIHDGVRYSGMGAWKGMMTDEEIWQVANFVSRIHELRAHEPKKAAR